MQQEEAPAAAAAAGHVTSAAQEPASVLQLFFLSLEGVYAVPFAAAAAAAPRKQQQQQGAAATSSSSRSGVSELQVTPPPELPDGLAAAADAALAKGGGLQQQQQQAAVSRVLALELQLQSNPFNVKAWDALLQEGENEQLYERILESFPASAVYWRRYAEYLYRLHRIQDAYAVYTRCILACPHIDLWKSYLSFLYRVGSVPEFVATLSKAVEKVGCDYRSGVLWLELLALYTRAYNTLLLLRGNTQGLLCSPQRLHGSSSSGRRSMEKGGGGLKTAATAVVLGSTPLMASSEEQRAFCLPLAADSPSLLQRFDDINVLRLLFQQCLSTAIEGQDAVYAAYCAFERSVGSSSNSNSQLATKLLADAESRYLHARKAYLELLRLAKNIDPQMVAVPLREAGGVETEQQLQQADAWLALLRYESSNPLRLSASPLLRRLMQTYQSCLLTCAFVPSLWYGFFQLLLAHNHPHRAVEVLRRAIDRFLPDDELLQLVLADFLEDRRLLRAAEDVYRSALALQVLQLSAQSPQSAAAAAGLVTTPHLAVGEVSSSAAAAAPAAGAAGISALLLLRYLSFLRRTKGESTWRAAFNEVAQLRGCPWEVYQKYAEAEWILYRNEAAALRALSLCWQRYRLHPPFLAAYANFLLFVGKRINAARELLYVSVCALQRETGRSSRMLWKHWISLERQFGDLLSLRRVLELRGRERLRLPLEERSVVGKMEGESLAATAAAGCGGVAAGGGGWESSSSSSLETQQAEVAVLCNFGVGRERKNEETHAREGIEEEEEEEEEEKSLSHAHAHAALAIRRRQFFAGGSLEEAASFYCVDHLVPRSSLLVERVGEEFSLSEEEEDAAEEKWLQRSSSSFVSCLARRRLPWRRRGLCAAAAARDGREGRAAPAGREQQRAAGRRSGPAAAAAGKKKRLRHQRDAKSETTEHEEETAAEEENEQEQQNEEGERSDVKRRATAAAQQTRAAAASSKTAAAAEEETAAVIARPDVSNMAAFHPELCDMYHPRAALLAQTRAAAQVREGVVDLCSRMLSPPKVLCDLLALLPKTKLKSFVDADVVDYAMATLQALQLPGVPVKKYKPLPVKELLLLRRSQLQCFQAMQQQQQLQFLLQQQQHAAAAASSAPALSKPPSSAPLAAAAAGSRERQQQRLPRRASGLEDDVSTERAVADGAAAAGRAAAARPALPSMRAQSLREMRRLLRPAAAARAAGGREGDAGAAAAAAGPGMSFIGRSGSEAAGGRRRLRGRDSVALSDVSSGDEGAVAAAAMSSSSAMSLSLKRPAGVSNAAGAAAAVPVALAAAADMTEAAAAGAASWLSGVAPDVSSFAAAAAAGGGVLPSFADSAAAAAHAGATTYRLVAPYPLQQTSAPQKQLAAAAAITAAEWGTGGPLPDSSNTYLAHMHLPAEQHVPSPPPGVWGGAAAAAGPPLGEAAAAGLPLYEAGSGAGGQMHHLLPPGAQAAAESHQQYLLPYGAEYLCSSAMVTRGGGVLAGTSSAAAEAHAAAAAGMPPPFHVLPEAGGLPGHPQYLGAAAAGAAGGGVWPAAPAAPAAAVTWSSAGVALPPAAAGLPGGAASAIPAAPFGSMQHHFYHAQLYPLHQQVAAASAVRPDLHPHTLWAAGRGAAAAAALGIDPAADLAAAAAGGALLGGAALEPSRSTRRRKRT